MTISKIRAACGPILLALLLAGCGLTPQGDAVRRAVQTKGAEVYDEGLANSEFFICRAASVGSVMRRYGRSRDLADAWRTLCEGADDASILAPPEAASGAAEGGPGQRGTGNS